MGGSGAPKASSASSLRGLLHQSGHLSEKVTLGDRARSAFKVMGGVLPEDQWLPSAPPPFKGPAWHRGSVSQRIFCSRNPEPSTQEAKHGKGSPTVPSQPSLPPSTWGLLHECPPRAQPIQPKSPYVASREHLGADSAGRACSVCARAHFEPQLSLYPVNTGKGLCVASSDSGTDHAH